MMAARPAARNIDAYIAGHPPQVREMLRRLRAAIAKAAPEATESIRYGIPTFVQNGNLVHFAAFRNHIGFYPTPSAITAFSRQLSGYRSSKGAVQFPLDEPLPLALIARIVRFRVKEARAGSPAQGGNRKGKRGENRSGTF